MQQQNNGAISNERSGGYCIFTKMFRAPYPFTVAGLIMSLNDGGTSFYRFLVLGPSVAERCQAGPRRLHSMLGGVVGVNANIFGGQIGSEEDERRRASPKLNLDVALWLR